MVVVHVEQYKVVVDQIGQQQQQRYGRREGKGPEITESCRVIVLTALYWILICSEGVKACPTFDVVGIL